MIRMSVPLSSRWVAKLCRSECAVTCLPIRARRLAARHADCRAPRTHVIAGIMAGKQPRTRPGPPPIGTQDLQQPRRQHGVAILAAFALSMWITIRLLSMEPTFRRGDLADAQARRIGRRQRDPVAQTRDGLKETRDLLTAQHHRQLLRFLAGDDAIERIFAAERDAVEEAQGRRPPD